MTDSSSARSDIEAVRTLSARWVKAVERGDCAALAAMMTDDVVVVHGDGRQLTGREAVLDDFARAFGKYMIAQEVDFDETVVSGDWAFDRTSVRTRLTTLDTGAATEIRSRTITLLRKERRAGWLVARVMGVVEGR